MFDEKEYIKYINHIKTNITITYVIIIVISFIIGIYLGAIPFIIIMILGILIANQSTLMMKIKVQKMKMEIDIYNKIIK
jgi:hypothetical protein